MKQVRCKKEYGVWFYDKVVPTDDNELDSPIYELSSEEDPSHCITFGSYNDMMFYIQTGIILA
jgi:hypothetical protein